jgi:hypothetical protein
MMECWMYFKSKGIQMAIQLRMYLFKITHFRC